MRLILAAMIVIQALITSPSEASAAPDTRPEPVAVFKVSHNGKGSGVEGGISGSAFFVSEDRALSADHVFRAALFKPNPGFTAAQVWLIHPRVGAIELSPGQVRTLSDKDTAIIRFSGAVVPKDMIFQLAEEAPPSKASVTTLGFPTHSATPVLKWNGSRIAIDSFHSFPMTESPGVILNEGAISIDAQDLKLRKVAGYRLNTRSWVGMSGGPTLHQGRVIGINSFGLPAGQAEKTETYLVSTIELSSALKLRNSR